MPSAFLITNGGLDLSTISSSYSPTSETNAWGASFVKLEDGRILLMYIDHDIGALCQSFAPDLSTFLSGNNTTSSKASIMTGSVFLDATVFWGGDGCLYYIVSYTYADNMRTQIYKSALKDGSDWTLHGTIQTITSAGLHYTNVPLNNSGGLPYMHSGLWIYPAPSYSVSSNYLIDHASIYVSSDNGATWTQTYYSSGGYTSALSKNIGFINGAFWWTFNDPNISKANFLKSTDGTNWNIIFTDDLNTPFPQGLSVFSNSNSLYLFDNSTANIYSVSSEPTSITDFVDTGFNLGIEDTDNTLMVINADNKVCFISACGSVQIISADNLISRKRIRGLKIT